MNRSIKVVLFIGNISCAVQGLESPLRNLRVTLENLTNKLKPFASKGDKASEVITVFYTTQGGNKESYQGFIDQIKSDLGEYSFDLKSLSNFTQDSKDEEKAIVLMHDTGSRLNMVTPNPKVLALLFQKVSKPIFILYTFDDHPSSTGVQRGHLADSIAGKLEKIEFKEIHLNYKKFAAFRDSIKAFWFWIGSGSSPYGTVNKTAKADYDMQIDEIKKLLSEK